MSNEIRTQFEGSLRFVQASGSGTAWTTAASTPSGIVGFVNSFNFVSAQTVTTMSDRGVPLHHKITQRAPITVNYEFMWTGSAAALLPLTASGTNAPMYHLEYRASAAERGSNSAIYYQFFGVALQQFTVTEQADGTRISLQAVALGMNGPTASGYLA